MLKNNRRGAKRKKYRAVQIWCAPDVARDRHVVADHLPQVVQHAERVDRSAPQARPPRLLLAELLSRLADQLGLVRRNRPEALRQSVDRAAEVAHQLDGRPVRAVDRRGDLVEVDDRRRRPEPLGRVVLDQVVADADDHVGLLEQPVRGLVVGVADAADEAVEQFARDDAVALEGAGHRQRSLAEQAPDGGRRGGLARRHPEQEHRPAGRLKQPGRAVEQLVRGQTTRSRVGCRQGLSHDVGPRHVGRDAHVHGPRAAAARRCERRWPAPRGSCSAPRSPTLHLVIGANSPTVSSIH